MPTLQNDNGSTELNLYGKGGQITAILPLPEDINFNTYYNWDKTGDAVGNVYDQITSGNMSALGMAIANNAARTLSGTAIGDAASLRIRVAPNPKEEVIFRGTTQREFDLTFNIAADRESDMQEYFTMINQLYWAAAPDTTNGNTFWEFPHVGELALKGIGTEIIMKRNIAIRGINTNLSPDGFMSTYVGGTPIHVKLQISFIELEVPTKRLDKKVFGFG